MNMNIRLLKGARGFTLIELMIAMLLSLFLMGAITYVVVNSNKNYNTTDSLSRLQENARFAVEFITRDLRRAGYLGCASDIDTVNSTLNGKAYGGGGLAINGLEGIDNIVAGTSAWAPSKTLAKFDTALPPVDGSDAIAARYLDLNNPVGVVKEMPNESAVIYVNPGHDIKEGDIIAVSDCQSADIMQVTHVNAAGSSASGKDEVGHNAGGSDAPGNETQKLSKSYGPGSQVMKFGSFAYYVGTNANKRPALFRVTTTGTQELVEGVEQMQILYGVASGTAGADRAPSIYVKAGDVGTANWRNVVSVRVGLLLSTIANTADGQYGVEVDKNTYDLNGTTIDPPDERRLRKMFVSTIMLRNIR